MLNKIPDLELKLDAYSDRLGNEADNLQLSAERLASVHEYFVNHGIDLNRITSYAHGEKNFVSLPGDLDTYMFDRRVVVSFKTPSQGLQNNLAIMTEKPSF